MSENSITLETCQVTKSSVEPASPGAVGLPYKPFDFRAKRWRNAAIARVADDAGYSKRGDNYAACGVSLGFGLDLGGRHLVAANFCHQRFCPLCSARLARKNARQLARVLLHAQEQHKGLRYIFLTLTCRNVGRDDLNACIVDLMQSWRRLTVTARWKRSVMGSFRAVEVTRNVQGGAVEYHPHLHVICAVPASYFSPGSPLYLAHKELVRMWGLALRVDYAPSVRVSAIYSQDGGDRKAGDVDAGAAVAEVSKYSVKDSDIISAALEPDEAAAVYRAMADALHHKRLTAFSGVLLRAARDLRAVDLEAADIVDADEDHDTTEAERMAYDIYERWAWGQSLGDYICTDVYDGPGGGPDA